LIVRTGILLHLVSIKRGAIGPVAVAKWPHDFRCQFAELPPTGLR